MAAIITQDMRIKNASNFIDTIADAGESIYFYIGRSQEWPNSDSDVADPEDSTAKVNETKSKIFAMKIVAGSDVTNAITRYNWTSGQTYSEWDDQDELIYNKQFYVITDEFNVYKCLQAGTGPSLNKPTGTNTAAQNDESADGYIWKYMFTLSGTQSTKFLTNSFIPVYTTDPAVDDGSQQYNVQASAADGGIHRIKVTAGGSGYTSIPTVVINGNGSGCSASATIDVNTGTVTAIDVPKTSVGSGYSIASVEITGGGGTGATARAIISPAGGHGYDPVRELGGYFMMANIQLDGAVGDGDFPIDNDYRQLGLMRNPLNFGTSTVATATTLNTTYTINYTNGSGTFLPDDLIEGSVTETQAYIDSVDTTNEKVRYHQEAASGFGTFQVGETITGSVSGATATISSVDDPESDPFTGEILYIENRTRVNRSENQIEDIKLVLEF